MFKIDSYVVYGGNVCHVFDIRTYNDKKYYVLKPVEDTSLTVSIPIDCNSVRGLISKKEALDLIDRIGFITGISIDNEKMYSNVYKDLFNEGSHESLIKIIKTTYRRNKKRSDDNKKISEMDDVFFKKAERLLYDELSIVLGMSYDDTKEYVIKKVEKRLQHN